MKLTITREQLQEGLVAVAASVPAKTTLPILSNILLEATRDGIRLSGTDLDIAVSTMVPASVDQEGAITLPARKLAGRRLRFLRRTGQQHRASQSENKLHCALAVRTSITRLVPDSGR